AAELRAGRLRAVYALRLRRRQPHAAVLRLQRARHLLPLNRRILALPDGRGQGMSGLDARRLLDALADPVVACDASDHLVYLDATAEVVLGWPAGELVGQPVDVIVPARLRSVGGQTFYRYVAART